MTQRDLENDALNGVQELRLKVDDAVRCARLLDEGRLFVPTRLPFSLGALVVLTLELTDREEPIEVMVRVCGRRHASSPRSLPSGVSLEPLRAGSTAIELLRGIDRGQVADLSQQRVQRQRGDCFVWPVADEREAMAIARRLLKGETIAAAIDDALDARPGGALKVALAPANGPAICQTLSLRVRGVVLRDDERLLRVAADAPFERASARRLLDACSRLVSGQRG